uniref:Uncharacterized protein n=1 Tax=Physcomitrium patens TaxID=3218 RepID=A0A2K1L4L8_PHYPA|nr:hypothetical protein PHYPA_003750 [Physcomitrium patens]
MTSDHHPPGLYSVCFTLPQQERQQDFEVGSQLCAAAPPPSLDPRFDGIIHTILAGLDSLVSVDCESCGC